MSDPTVINVSVSVFVAALALTAGIINERYKRHRDTVAVAAILHADIAALQKLTLAFDTVKNWEFILALLEDGQNIKIPEVYSPEPTQGPVFHAYIDKIGLLDTNDARDVILFYEYLVGIRSILRNLIGGAWDSHAEPAKIKAIQVRTGLRFWSLSQEITARLLPALDRTSTRKFLAVSKGSQSTLNLPATPMSGA